MSKIEKARTDILRAMRTGLGQQHEYAPVFYCISLPNIDLRMVEGLMETVYVLISFKETQIEKRLEDTDGEVDSILTNLKAQFSAGQQALQALKDLREELIDSSR